MSSKETSNNPGLCPVKGQKSGIKSWTRAQNHLSSLSLSTDKIPPHFHMLVIYPAFIFFLILSSEIPNQQSGEQFCLLQACQQFHFLIPKNVQVPKITLQNAGWKCFSVPFDTVSPMGMLF